MNFSKDKIMLGFTITACVGLFVFIIGLIFSVKTIFLDVRGKESTYAEIISLDGESTTVRYIAGGREYTKRFNAYSSTYYVGKEIKIFYSKAHPQKSFIANIRYLILIAPGMGLIITGVGGIGLFVSYMKSDGYKKLEY